jgi:glycerophosphoryl diester phosphodiesterase
LTSDLPISVTRNGHRTYFKWHRARRRLSDPVFTGRRIIEGMQAGASVEVDLVVQADSGFAVLHDITLERETTGHGPVRETPAAVLRELQLRGNDGQPIADRVMLLEDLAALIARDGAHPEALLQLDFKEDAAALAPEAVRNFATALRPVAGHFMLSSGDAAAVAMLAGAVPGLHVGYDPCHDGAIERLTASRDYSGFVRDAVRASPAAELVYLAWQIVLEADRDGFDMIGAFHEAGRRVDAYTIRQLDAETRPRVERLLELKVDQITTDDPEGMAAALA